MNLHEWLEREPSTAERLSVIASLCGALAESHKLGAALGGLEPGAIEVVTGDSARLEPVSPGAGSPYAAPERKQGGPPTTKGDIYSAAAVFYEILSGKPPFASDPPRPLQETRPDLSQDLTDAISACMEQDPEWRPADLSYLLAVVQQLRKDSPTSPRAQAPHTGAARASRPPSQLLEPASRKRHDDRGSLTRALPVILVVVAIAATGGAWLWYDVLRPGRSAAAVPSREPLRSTSEPPVAPTTPAGAGEPLAPPTPAPSVAVPGPQATARAEPSARPVPPPKPSPARAEPSAPSLPTATPSASLPAIATPAPERTSATSDAAAAAPDLEPGAAQPQTPEVGEQPVGPATIRAVAPFRLRAGALSVLDVHGSGLRSDHRVRIVPHRKREGSAGFSVTRYQLRNPALLLVFVQVDPAVPQGKYALSLVDQGGAETNPFTIEVVNK